MGSPSANLKSPMHNAVIRTPYSSVSPQRTSSLANALITMATGPATISPRGRTASPNKTRAPRTNNGPRSVQRSRRDPPPTKQPTTSSTPNRPSSAASALGNVPGPSPAAAPPGRSRLSQAARPATAMIISPPRKSWRDSIAEGDWGGLDLLVSIAASLSYRHDCSRRNDHDRGDVGGHRRTLCCVFENRGQRCRKPCTHAPTSFAARCHAGARTVLIYIKGRGGQVLRYTFRLLAITSTSRTGHQPNQRQE